jgi:hypothetical protein
LRERKSCSVKSASASGSRVMTIMFRSSLVA